MVLKTGGPKPKADEAKDALFRPGLGRPASIVRPFVMAAFILRELLTML